MKTIKDELFSTIEKFEPNILTMLSNITAIPAISPKNGGEGEYLKAVCILEKIKKLGFQDVTVYNCPDALAPSGVRPSIVLKIPGRTKRRLWIVSHIDVVPEGDILLWNTDPFKAEIKDGKIYGRGVNDNGQELVSSLYAAAALKELGIQPEYEVCICMAADEEVGSQYGICHLIELGLFRDDDIVIVPDGGNEDGSFIEIAEKSIFWFEFEFTGRQVHASMPDLGVNACRAANEFSYLLDIALHKAFPESNALFEPPLSTFEPTRRNTNVSNVNTVPGREIFSFDCRVLPGIPLEDVQKIVDAEVKKITARHKVEVSYRFLQKNQAPEPTSPDAFVVEILKDAIQQVLPVVPKVGGIGGGTCAAFFRKVGIPAAVWAQEADCAHMPNEYAVIEHMINEAKVFALLMMGK